MTEGTPPPVLRLELHEGRAAETIDVRGDQPVPRCVARNGE